MDSAAAHQKMLGLSLQVTLPLPSPVPAIPDGEGVHVCFCLWACVRLSCVSVCEGMRNRGESSPSPRRRAAQRERRAHAATRAFGLDLREFLVPQHSLFFGLDLRQFLVPQHSLFRPPVLCPSTSPSRIWTLGGVQAPPTMPPARGRLVCRQQGVRARGKAELSTLI